MSVGHTDNDPLESSVSVYNCEVGCNVIYLLGLYGYLENDLE